MEENDHATNTHASFFTQLPHNCATYPCSQPQPQLGLVSVGEQTWSCLAGGGNKLLQGPVLHHVPLFHHFPHGCTDQPHRWDKEAQGLEGQGVFFCGRGTRKQIGGIILHYAYRHKSNSLLTEFGFNKRGHC